MSATALREYQTAAVHAVFNAIEDDFTRIMYTLPTGAGKTTVFAELVRILTEYSSKKVLVLAHRRELIQQAYQRICEHCGLDEYQVGIELAETKASPHSKVIVGSIMTVKNGSRLPDWKPDVIITDECHRSAGKSFLSVYERFGVNDGTCIHIGCTATAKRTDKQSLYAIRPSGDPVELWDKKKEKRFLADPATSVYQKHVFEYSVLDAIKDGYLVDIDGHTIRTDTDLSKVKTGNDGDFMEGELARAVDNAQRTLQALNGWKKVAGDRQTLVFCASVEHAHHSAELWRQAGYTAEALDGESSSWDRGSAIQRFKDGDLQVLCNCGLFTEGTDLPSCGCIVHLRPTKSWNLYVQMTGRGMRPLTGILNGIETAEERREAIAGSAKPKCIVVDVVDLLENSDLCAVPSILDLPANLDLEGKSMTEAKSLLDEFEENRNRIIGECPLSFSELEVILRRVDVTRNEKVENPQDWKATSGGYRFNRMPIGYQGELIERLDEDGYAKWELVVRHAGQELLRKTARRNHPKTGEPYPVEDFLNKSAPRMTEAVEMHKATLPKQSRGTLNRLSVKQINCLKVNGHSREEIDCMPYAKAKALIDTYMNRFLNRTSSEGGGSNVAPEFATVS